MTSYWIHRRSWRGAIPAAVLFGALFAAPAPTRAQRADEDVAVDEDEDADDAESAGRLMLAGDLNYAGAVSGLDVDAGAGFALRAGAHFHLPFIVSTPEGVFAYDGFSGGESPSLYRGMVGLRLGIGEIVRPGIYGHVGIGRLDADVPSSEPDPSRTAFCWDLGLELELTLLPLVNLGVHGAYNRLVSSDDGPAFPWWTLGAHAALIL